MVSHSSVVNLSIPESPITYSVFLAGFTPVRSKPVNVMLLRKPQITTQVSVLALMSIKIKFHASIKHLKQSGL